MHSTVPCHSLSLNASVFQRLSPANVNKLPCASYQKKIISPYILIKCSSHEKMDGFCLDMPLFCEFHACVNLPLSDSLFFNCSAGSDGRYNRVLLRGFKTLIFP